jgi:hypothetical protein
LALIAIRWEAKPNANPHEYWVSSNRSIISSFTKTPQKSSSQKIELPFEL